MNKVRTLINVIASRVIVFYGFVMLLYMFSVDHSSLRVKTSVATLNRYMPSMTYIIGANEQGLAVDKDIWLHYIKYYEKVLKLISHDAASRGLLAYCYYQVGKENKAIKQYQEAIALNPHFFWFHYNLGVIFSKTGQAEKAVMEFQEAVAVKPAPSVFFMRASRAYYPIVQEGNFKEDKVLFSALKRGYRKAYEALVLNLYKKNLFSEMLMTTNQAMASGSRDHIFIFYGGVASFRLGDMEKAIIYFMEFLKKEPDHPEALGYLVQAFKLMKQDQAAQAFMRRLKSTPQGDAAILRPLDELKLILY